MSRKSPADSHAVVARMAKDRVVPVVVLDDARLAAQTAAALAAGGCGLIEVTLRTAAALPAIAAIALESTSIVGAGTVLNSDQVGAAHSAGARFIVSPGLDATVIAAARALGLAVIPGVSTATEVQTAWNLGLKLVKFFPASTSGGAPAIRMLSTAFREIQFMPSGGIDETNLSQYLAIPAVMACGGTWLASTELIAAGSFAEITRRTTAAIRIGQAARK